MNQNPYLKTDWSDHIIDPTQYEKDANGAVVIDPLTGKPKPYVIQEGTRFTAGRANNIEDGIYGAYGWLVQYYEEIAKLRVQLEMVGRVPINNGTFFDTLDNDTPKQLTRLRSAAVAQTALTVGATEITLDSTPFTVGQYVTVFDDANQESVKVTAIVGGKITVGALAKAYKKGAVVALSNAELGLARQRILFGNWGTYSIAVSEAV
ncbi:hypothetical protein [Sporosarcina psychrophila]|uniref:Uncharacterized protein n=1 Tax=Sporosarcina psychrophila TaxID=1476 RepID=A0ABV2KBT1_SPOPS